MSIEGPLEARAVVGMKGLEDFISHTKKDPLPGHQLKKDPLLGHRLPQTKTHRRIRRTRCDESRSRSVRHTSVCTPTKGGKRAQTRTLSREGHSFHVSQARKNVICSSSTNDRSSQRRPRGLHAGVIPGENETTNRWQIRAVEGHLCVHTIGSSSLFRLGHSFHVPCRRSTGCALGKMVLSSPRNTAARQESSM